MNKQIAKPFAAVIGSIVLALSVVSCSSGGGEKTDALPPIIAEVGALQGETFEINSKQPLVINAENPTEWSGESADPAIAEFSAGKDDGSATFNPGFTAKSVGETAASVTSPEGEKYDFNIVVVEAK